jgi:hypothetical protein
VPAGGDGPAPPSSDPLEAFATNLVARAAEGRIDPLIGRTLELERMTQVLCRRRKNNPLLVGSRAWARRRSPKALRCASIRATVPEVLQNVEGLRARSGRARRRHAVSRSISKSASSRSSIAFEGGQRDPVHRRDPLARRRRCGVGGAMDAGNL